MAAADEGITIPITVTGADAAVAELRKPEQTLRQYIMTAKAANDAQRTMAKEAAAAAKELQKKQQVFMTLNSSMAASAANTGNLGKAFRVAAESSAKMSAALSLISAGGGAATGAIGKLAGGLGVLSGGPIGIAVAGVGLLVAAFSRASTAAATTADEIKKTTKSLEDFMSAAASASKKKSTLSHLNMGLGSVTEQEGFLAAAEANLAGLAPGTTVAERIKYEREVERRKELLATAGEEANYDLLHPEESSGGGGGGGGRGRGGGGGRAARDDGGLIEEMLRGRTRQPSLDDLMQRDRRDTSFLGNVGALDLSLDTSLDPTGGGKVGAASGGTKKSAADQMVRDAERVKVAWGDAYSTMQGGAEATFAALITGNAGAAKAALAATGDRMVADGTHKLFEGAAALVLGQPSGAALLGIGAGEIAFGTGLGAAMKGGGGGGGAGARPTPGAGGGGDRRNEDRGPTVVNVYSMNPTAETGRAIDRSMRAAARKRGN